METNKPPLVADIITIMTHERSVSRWRLYHKSRKIFNIPTPSSLEPRQIERKENSSNQNPKEVCVDRSSQEDKFKFEFESPGWQTQFGRQPQQSKKKIPSNRRCRRTPSMPMNPSSKPSGGHVQIRVQVPWMVTTIFVKTDERRKIPSN